MFDVTAAYDEVMSCGSAPDLKVASTTTRMYDMVNRGPAFDEIYIHPPLLEACAHVIGEPFKLSSLASPPMPPGGPYWTAAQLALFTQWQRDGYQP